MLKEIRPAIQAGTGETCAEGCGLDEDVKKHAGSGAEHLFVDIIGVDFNQWSKFLD